MHPVSMTSSYPFAMTYFANKTRIAVFNINTSIFMYYSSIFILLLCDVDVVSLDVDVMLLQHVMWTRLGFLLLKFVRSRHLTRVPSLSL